MSNKGTQVPPKIKAVGYVAKYVNGCENNPEKHRHISYPTGYVCEFDLVWCSICGAPMDKSKTACDGCKHLGKE